MQEDLRMSIVPPAASRIQALPNTASSTSGSACAPQRGTNGPQRPPATTQHQHTTVPQQQHPSAPQQQYQQPPQQQHRPPAPQSGPSGRTVALQSDNHASRPPQPSRPQPQASSHQPSPSNASLPATTPEHTEAIAAHIAHARVLNPPLEGIYQVLLESDEGIRNYIFNSAVDTVPWGDYRDLAFFWDVVNGQKTVSMLIGIKTEGSPISYIPDFRSRAAAAYRRFGLPAPRRTLNPKSSSSIPAGQSSSNNAPSSSSSVPPPAQQTTSPSSTAPIPNGRPSVLGPPQAAKATTSIASSSHSPPPAASSNTISTMALAPGKAAAPSNAPVPTKGPAPAKAPAPVKAPAQTNAIASGSGSGSGESAPVWPVPSATKASSPYVPAFIRNGVLTLEDPTPPKASCMDLFSMDKGRISCLFAISRTDLPKVLGRRW
ncbi:hypothetical protein BDV98DRAFT_237491 [Pterulicium gracile]|uniref:Uncharacterized protein n=1 Tax=Pterulicium gracile TaxID=1884261 RepID=A0A5C3QUY2_9AGAR|nr:hypothetical protein BDV98DRAFT_237491 [Pterula gracilis]